MKKNSVLVGILNSLLVHKPKKNITTLEQPLQAKQVC